MAFGSFSLCCYTCGKHVSVSLRPVYDIFQRVSGQIPLQIVHADMPDRVLHVRAAAEARACDMRREQHVLHVPQRTVRRKRFGLEHIECDARPRWPSCKADTRSSVPARLPRPTLTSTAPAFIACRRSAVSRPAVSRVFGRQPMTMSARGSRASNAIECMRFLEVCRYSRNPLCASRRAQLRQRLSIGGPHSRRCRPCRVQVRSFRKSSPHGRIFARYAPVYCSSIVQTSGTAPPDCQSRTPR